MRERHVAASRIKGRNTIGSTIQRISQKMPATMLRTAAGFTGLRSLSVSHEAKRNDGIGAGVLQLSERDVEEQDDDCRGE